MKTREHEHEWLESTTYADLAEHVRRFVCPCGARAKHEVLNGQIEIESIEESEE